MNKKNAKPENLEYSTPYTIVPKLVRTYEQHKDPNSWSNEKFAKEFAQMYLDYYASPDRIKQRNGLTMYEFVGLYRMPWQSFKDLRKKFLCVERAVEYAKTIIAMRRENGYETGELTGKTMHMMRHYHALWEEDFQDNRDFKLQLADKTKPDAKAMVHVVRVPCHNENHDNCCKKQP